MHDSERYGYLSANGKPIPSTVLARRTGCDSLEQFDALMVELESAYVPSRTPDGVIYSRRMVRDHKQRQEKQIEWRQRQRDSRKCKTGNGNVTDKSQESVHETVPPLQSSVSSSSSSSKQKPKTPPKSPKGTEEFERFWAVYPRREGRGAAEKAFLKLKPTGELVSEMIAAVENHKLSAQWTRDNGQYIPHPATWLNQHRWKDDLNATKPKHYSEATARSLSAIEEYHRLKGD